MRSSLQVYYEKRKRRQEEKAASKKERKGPFNNGARLTHLPLLLCLPPARRQFVPSPPRVALVTVGLTRFLALPRPASPCASISF